MGNCGQNGQQRSGFYSMFSTLFGLKEKKGTLDKRGDQKPQTGLLYGKYMDIRGHGHQSFILLVHWLIGLGLLNSSLDLE